MGGFALGGRFTTLEGLMTNVLEQVENNPFLGTTGIQGDSTTPGLMDCESIKGEVIDISLFQRPKRDWKSLLTSSKHCWKAKLRSFSSWTTRLATATCR